MAGDAARGEGLAARLAAYAAAGGYMRPGSPTREFGIIELDLSDVAGRREFWLDPSYSPERDLDLAPPRGSGDAAGSLVLEASAAGPAGARESSETASLALLSQGARGLATWRRQREGYLAA